MVLLQEHWYHNKLYLCILNKLLFDLIWFDLICTRFDILIILWLSNRLSNITGLDFMGLRWRSRQSKRLSPLRSWVRFSLWTHVKRVSQPSAESRGFSPGAAVSSDRASCYLLTLQSYKKYNNDWRYGQQDMSPMCRPTWYNTISRHTGCPQKSDTIEIISLFLRALSRS
jgi:hypothetical protein